MKKVITDYLDETEKLYPNKDIFVEDNNTKINYSNFCLESKVIGTNIIKKYELYNEPIAIFINKSIDALKAMFGVLYSGNFYTIFDVTSPQNRIDTIIDTLKPKLILTNTKNIDKIKEYKYDIEILNIDEIDRGIDYSILNNINRVSTNPAYVLFTSGSTGVPKGTVINHDSLISYVKWFKDTFNINENTIFGSQTPFYFSMSVSDIFSTIMSGATFCLIPKMYFSFPMKLIEYLNEYKINTIYWVPSALSIVARLNTFDYAKPEYLEKILFAGEVMPMPSLNIWRRNLPNAMYANLFGPTETVDICSYYIVNREFNDNETLPIGIPCENAEIILINENGKLAVDDEIGEIYVKSIFVGSGYYNNKEKTNEAFVQNPLHDNYIDIVYKTGDLGKKNQYGEIEYLGRKDYQIKHMGYRIELGEIETNVNSMKEMTTCACIYDKQHSQIVLFYEGNYSEDDIVTYANEHLLNYMQPNVIVKLDKMPYNQNGKIDRAKLKSDYEKGK